MKIIQSPLIARKVKKLPKSQKLKLDEVLNKLIRNPTMGEEKKGDLQGIFVLKFKINDTQYLLAYRFRAEVLELITIGAHENYYRDMKSYLKSK